MWFEVQKKSESIRVSFRVVDNDHDDHNGDRVEICRDCHDRRSCKNCASCVNFPRKQRDFSHNLHRTSRFTHTKSDFSLKL